MADLINLEPDKVRDPKLGIKSSFTGFKQGVAALALFFLANKDALSLETFRAGSNDGLIFGDEQMKQLFHLFQSNGFGDDEIASVSETVSKSQLLELHLESLVVGFEVFLPLAEVSFVDQNLTNSAERTGGKRYPKRFVYSNGLFSLCGGTRGPDRGILEVFFHWLLDEPVPDNIISFEKDIKRRIVSLSARTQYRVTRDKIGKSAIEFNTIGLYSHLLQARSVDLRGDEKRGTVRILFSALKQNMFPGIIAAKDIVELNPSETPAGFSESEIKEIFALEQKSQELKNVTDITKPVTHGSGNGSFDIGYASGTLKLEVPKHAMNVIFYGVPGAGKSYQISSHLGPEDKIERVVFHPDFLYSGFVGQIMPIIREDSVAYEFRPGPFTKILKSAFEEPETQHVLIIEEINRGNAASIFGDIFQLLDRDENGASKYYINNPELASFVTGDPDQLIGIPSNLRLLATMNTSDQNVFTLDTAFQRRWSMRMVRNDIDKVPYSDSSILDTSVTWKRFNDVINAKILESNQGMSSTEDKRLGAFFVSPSELEFKDEDSPGVFAEKTLKYLWDDALKFSRQSIFDRAEQQSLEDIITRFNTSLGDDRWRSILTREVNGELISDPSDVDPDVGRFADEEEN